MSADGSVEIEWADGTHKFRLPLGQLRELQDKCNAGPAEILNRLRLQTWRVDDVREIIRLGLIGGGVPPLDALTLVVRYVDQRPWMESVPTATAILLAALVGIPDNQPGKKKTDSSSETKESNDSTSGNFTPTVLQ